jgi:cobalt-zinc-cadmium efflux system membrane fusion protein
MQLKNQFGKISQPLMIGLLLLITFLIAVGIWFSSKDTTTDEHAHEESEHADEPEAEKGHAEEGEIQLTAQQLTEQGIQIASAQQGVVSQVTVLPGKLVVNTDQQAHISPNFGGHVEQVNVELGQNVQKGQTLAVLSVPELMINKPICGWLKPVWIWHVKIINVNSSYGHRAFLPSKTTNGQKMLTDKRRLLCSPCKAA